jgi:hypothetical protein
MPRRGTSLLSDLKSGIRGFKEDLNDLLFKDIENHRRETTDQDFRPRSRSRRVGERFRSRSTPRRGYATQAEPSMGLGREDRERDDWDHVHNWTKEGKGPREISLFWHKITIERKDSHRDSGSRKDFARSSKDHIRSPRNSGGVRQEASERRKDSVTSPRRQNDDRRKSSAQRINPQHSSRNHVSNQNINKVPPEVREIQIQEEEQRQDAEMRRKARIEYQNKEKARKAAAEIAAEKMRKQIAEDARRRQAREARQMALKRGKEVQQKKDKERRAKLEATENLKREEQERKDKEKKAKKDKEERQKREREEQEKRLRQEAARNAHQQARSQPHAFVQGSNARSRGMANSTPAVAQLTRDNVKELDDGFESDGAPQTYLNRGIGDMARTYIEGMESPEQEEQRLEEERVKKREEEKRKRDEERRRRR